MDTIMIWATILFGIDIICYTFAVRTLFVCSVDIYLMSTDQNYRSWNNASNVSRDLTIGIIFTIIGTVPLCYI